MNRLYIGNARIVLEDSVTDVSGLSVTDGVIDGVTKDKTSGKYIDARGGYVFPGFIDLHVHGGGGADFMDGTPEAFETAVKAHLKRGTTTLLPTSTTSSTEELRGFISAYNEFIKKSEYSDCVAGIHMEGPYLASADGKSRGAQNADHIRKIDFDEIEELLSLANGSIVRWDAAPEIEGAAAFAEMMVKKGVICAIAHTNATAEEALKGFEAGFSHVTHFYNAVTMYAKRGQKVTAGVVEAAYLNDGVTVELICDGKHVPKECLKLALKIKGSDRVAGITDATRLSCTDMKSGKLGSLKNGKEVIVEDGVAKLPDRSSYAGSICTTDRALRVLCVDYGIDVITASHMISSTPAKLLGLFDKKGSVSKGKIADLVVTDRDFNVICVLKSGSAVK